MAYEPTLIIKKADLTGALTALKEEPYSSDEETVRVANYLLEVDKYPTIKFDELELVLCHPEFSGFNLAVRNKLKELDVTFREDW